MKRFYQILVFLHFCDQDPKISNLSHFEQKDFP